MMFIERTHYAEALYPTNDYIFHKIFGYEGNEKITKAFLNSILSHPVEEIRLDSNPVLMKEKPFDKQSIVDIKAILDENNEKKICNIEMQVKNEYNMEHRLPYYWAKIYSNQLVKGFDYDKLCKTICILIANFELDKEDNDFYSEYGILKKNHRGCDRLLTDDMELYIIELPKLKRKLENLDGIDNEKLVTWLRFIQNPNELEEKDMSDNEELEQAYKILDDVNSNEYERDLAERRLDWIRCENDARAGLRKEEAKEIAKRLLEMKLSIENIMKATGLTKEEIKKLE